LLKIASKILVLSEDLPVVVEIVDRAEKIRMFLPFVDETVQQGMVSLEDVQIISYRRRQRKNDR